MNLEQTSFTTWEEYVRKSIDDLRAKYPTYNLTQIAVKININRSTLTRILNEGIKPQLDNYIKIINGSGNGTLLGHALEAYDQNLLSSSKNHIQVAMTEKNSFFTTPEIESVLDEKDCFVAFLLASKKDGTTEVEVSHVLGAKGISSLKLLVVKNLLIEEDSIYKIANKNEVFVRSFESIKTHLNTYAEHYKIAHVGKERNYVHSVSEGLSLKGVKAVQEAHRKFHKEIVEVMRNEENLGQIPMFSVGFCDTFTDVNFNHENKGILQ